MCEMFIHCAWVSYVRILTFKQKLLPKIVYFLIFLGMSQEGNSCIDNNGKVQSEKLLLF